MLSKGSVGRAPAADSEVSTALGLMELMWLLDCLEYGGFGREAGGSVQPVLPISP